MKKEWADIVIGFIKGALWIMAVALVWSLVFSSSAKRDLKDAPRSESGFYAPMKARLFLDNTVRIVGVHTTSAGFYLAEVQLDTDDEVRTGNCILYALVSPRSVESKPLNSGQCYGKVFQVGHTIANQWSFQVIDQIWCRDDIPMTVQLPQEEVFVPETKPVSVVSNPPN